ncbi:MAG: UDP-3-O-(3-hydroxymyristoyl)glucosamine N-acyltransferase [Armatimonadetes bacterium]|nr:UDP-3-O-(3-hydroxymyristoyl)glucosamine N-acyltransferase [Armatimonadota bacterium]
MRDLATLLGGEVLGEGETEVAGVAEIEAAGPADLVLAVDERRLQAAEGSAAAAVLVPAALAPAAKPAVRVPNVRLAFAAALDVLMPPEPIAWEVHPSAVLGRGVRLGSPVSVGPLVAIGDEVTLGDRVVIGAGAAIGRGTAVGDDSVIAPNVTVYPGTVIGRRVRIQGGAVIGGDGFGYARTPDGRHRKIPHHGRVVLEDDVEIGANATVDRATLGETRIGRGTKIDNLVMVAHNVTLGEDVIVVAQSGIAGSARVGNRVIIAAQGGVADHATVGDGAMVHARAGVTKDVPPGEKVSGFPARSHQSALRVEATLRRLPELVRRLERRLREGR